jgi:uncharacterized protein (DUF934 family)
MPRRLLRDGRIVEDDWAYLAADPQEGAAGSGAGGAGGGQGIILTFEQWLAQRAQWLTHSARLGVVLLPAQKVELLAPDLARFDLVGAEFSGPSEGRGYTQGRLLRERYAFRGELRATGYVRIDQLFLLARCGFNSFELAESDFAHALEAFGTFTAEYQPSNDAGLPHRLQHRDGVAT